MSGKTVNGLFFQTSEYCQYLPVEIVTKILFANSSSQDLYRFAKVCKLWRSIIFSQLIKDRRRVLDSNSDGPDEEDDEVSHKQIFNVNIAPRYVGRALEYRTVVHKGTTGSREEWSSIYTTSDFLLPSNSRERDAPPRKNRSIFVTAPLREVRDIVYTFDVNINVPHYSSRCQIIDLCSSGITDNFLSTIRPPIFLEEWFPVSCIKRPRIDHQLQYHYPGSLSQHLVTLEMAKEMECNGVIFKLLVYMLDKNMRALDCFSSQYSDDCEDYRKTFPKGVTSSDKWVWRCHRWTLKNYNPDVRFLCVRTIRLNLVPQNNVNPKFSSFSIPIPPPIIPHTFLSENFTDTMSFNFKSTKGNGAYNGYAGGFSSNKRIKREHGVAYRHDFGFRRFINNAFLQLLPPVSVSNLSKSEEKFTTRHDSWEIGPLRVFIGGPEVM